jgi:hypothetical protein
MCPAIPTSLPCALCSYSVWRLLSAVLPLPCMVHIEGDMDTYRHTQRSMEEVKRRLSLIGILSRSLLVAKLCACICAPAEVASATLPLLSRELNSNTNSHRTKTRKPLTQTLPKHDTTTTNTTTHLLLIYHPHI